MRNTYVAKQELLKAQTKRQQGLSNSSGSSSTNGKKTAQQQTTSFANSAFSKKGSSSVPVINTTDFVVNNPLNVELSSPSNSGPRNTSQDPL